MVGEIFFFLFLKKTKPNKQTYKWRQKIKKKKVIHSFRKSLKKNTSNYTANIEYW